MDKRRIVITGIGVVAPNGIGKEEFLANCSAGVSGIKPITLFDVSKYRCKYAGEVSNFQPEQYLGPKGLRNLDRTTLLALVAAKLAIEDARLKIADANRDDIGVVLGSTMGSVHSISEFDKEGLREGPRYVNPAQFPNTVINSPASQVAIRFGLRGLNSTISTGFTASLDAIGYALDMLRLNRAKVLLVGGVEELCIQTFLGFYKLGFLATSQNGAPPRSAPFDAQSRGALLGEGCAFFVLESDGDAQERGATQYAEVVGYGTEFHPDSMYRYDPAAVGASHAIRHALEDADLEPDDIDQVSASANASKTGDAMEMAALRNVFGSRVETLLIQTVKLLLGESFSAAGSLQLAATIGTLARQSVPVAAGMKQRASSVSHEAGGEFALVESLGPTGSSSAVVLRVPELH